MLLKVILAVMSLFVQAAGQPVPDRPCRSDGWLVLCADTGVAYSTRSVGKEVISIDLRSRRVTWQVDVPGSVNSNVVATSSIVAFACGLGDICGVSRSTGKEVWRVQEKSKQLAVVGNYVVAQTATREGAIGIEDKSGRVVWRHQGRRGRTSFYLRFFDVSGTFLLTSAFRMDGLTGAVLTRWPRADDPGISAATFAGNLQVIAQERSLRAYRDDSREAWELSLPVEGFERPKVIYLRGSGISVVAAMAETKPGAGLMRLVRVSSAGSVVWRRDIRDIDSVAIGPHGPLALIDQRVIVVTRPANALTSGMSTISSFDFESGNATWSTPIRAGFMSADLVTLEPGRAYLQGTVDGGWSILMALDVRDGRLESLMKLSQ